MGRKNRTCLLIALLAVLPMAGCGEDDDGTLVLYTSVTQGTVDAVVEGFRTSSPGTEVQVFRAPTGEVNARIAAERREGGVRADVLWLTDPLSMQQYGAEDLLRVWDPEGAAAVPPEYRSDRFWGTRLLSLVIVVGSEVEEPPASWGDLVSAAAAGGVAMPDPGFAGSAFAALGYFALTDGYGLGYYRRLYDAGAEQVQTPGDVVTGVAEGQYRAGITLWFSADNAIEKGSPIEIVWPEGGAITLYSPIAALEGSGESAQEFVEYVLSREAQQIIAGTGWQPVHPDVAWTIGGPQVSVDWTNAFDRQEELLAEYRAIFGG
jgi:iron(III) transport system substrate-binding protein